jgi:hypothetical protein
MGDCKILRKLDLSYNELFFVNPMAVKQLCLESLELSANPFLHEQLVTNARLGMENLIDFVHSGEYKEMHTKNKDYHPQDGKDKDKDKDKDKKKQPEKKEAEKQPSGKGKAKEKDDDDGGEEDDE